MSVRLVFAVTIMGVAAVLSPMAMGAEGTVEESAVIAEGRIGSHHWGVEAAREGNSVCLEVSVLGRSAWDESGRGQCSYPVKQRGILLVEGNRQRGKQPPAAMVVGGAFSPAVKRVVARKFDGTAERLALAPAGEAGSLLSRFRFAALGVRGPWCAQSVTTYDKQDHVLFKASWQSFDAEWRGNPAYNPAAICPR